MAAGIYFVVTYTYKLSMVTSCCGSVLNQADLAYALVTGDARAATLLVTTEAYSRNQRQKQDNSNLKTWGGLPHLRANSSGIVTGDKSRDNHLWG